MGRLANQSPSRKETVGKREGRKGLLCQRMNLFLSLFSFLGVMKSLVSRNAFLSLNFTLYPPQGRVYHLVNLTHTLHLDFIRPFLLSVGLLVSYKSVCL